MDEINYYFSLSTAIIVPILSVINNIFVVSIFMRKPLRGQSMSRYLAILAICDTMNVIVSSLENIEGLIQFNDFSCRLITYVAAAFFQLIPYIKMIFSVDRLVSVNYSRRFLFKNTFKFQSIVFSTTFVITSIQLYHIIFSMEIL